jgi:hypothetical protein
MAFNLAGQIRLVAVSQQTHAVGLEIERAEQILNGKIVPIAAFCGLLDSLGFWPPALLAHASAGPFPRGPSHCC